MTMACPTRMLGRPPTAVQLPSPQLKRKTCSLGEGEINAGTPWRCWSLGRVEGASPHLNAGLLSSRGWQHRGQAGPFPSCPNAPREAGLATRTGSHTGWHLLSHWKEDGGHRRENNHKEFQGVLCGLPERPGRVSEAQSGPKLRANSWSKGEMREETQPLPRSLLPLPPSAPARAVSKPPAVPAPGSRSIVGIGLVGSKKGTQV